jgi:hypothetical protein
MKLLRMRALENMLELAREHVVEQGGNNRGPMVGRIIEYAHGIIGEPWCVDTIIYAYGHAGSRDERPGSPRAVRLMAQPGVRITRAPRPGDIVRYSFPGNPYAHTGLLVGWRRLIHGRYIRCPRALATHLVAVEGNTTSTGALESDSRDGGDGVHIKTRPRTLAADYLSVAR